LDMGEQLSILDLANNMIELYGMVPGKDIEIVFTGPKHGEKLNEELIAEDEAMVKTEFEYIFEAKNNGMAQNISKEELMNILFCIEREIQTNDYSNLFKDMRRLIPDFDETEVWYRWD
jgi:FlaA1/EpsC-like NDP-sugar epimerase